MQGGLIAVAGEAVERDVALGDAFGEFVGAGADGRGGEVLAEAFDGFGGDHHAGAVGEHGDEGGVGGGEFDADGGGGEDVNAGDGFEFAFADAVGRGAEAFEVPGDGVGGHFLAVLVEDVVTQGDGEGEAVGGPVPFGGELGSEGEVGFEVPEFVAHGGEHEAAAEGAAEGGVEAVGFFLGADPQRAGGVGRGHWREEGEGEEGGVPGAHGFCPGLQVLRGC